MTGGAPSLSCFFATSEFALTTLAVRMGICGQRVCVCVGRGGGGGGGGQWAGFTSPPSLSPPATLHCDWWDFPSLDWTITHSPPPRLPHLVWVGTVVVVWGHSLCVCAFVVREVWVCGWEGWGGAVGWFHFSTLSLPSHHSTMSGWDFPSLDWTVTHSPPPRLPHLVWVGTVWWCGGGFFEKE